MKLRSGANHSLLCLSCVVASEACFLVASLLQRWSWLWQGFRIWRLVMASILLLQVIYYKHCARNDFAAAVEAPNARVSTARSVDEHGFYTDPLLGEYEEAATGHGWPVRTGRAGIAGTHGIGVNSASSSKAAGYGMASQFGETLLGQPVPVRYTDPFAPQGRAHSPARSRLPSSQQHLLAQDAPRTISPNLSPKITTARSIVAPGSSSHQRVGSSSASDFSRIGPGLQQSSSAVGRLSPRTTGGSVSPSLTFQSSPSSAFRPVIHSETVSSASVVDFAGVQTTNTGYQLLSTASTNNPEPNGSEGGGAHSNFGKLTTIGLTVTMIVGLVTLAGVAANSNTLHSSAESEDALHSVAGRALLSSDAASSSSSLMTVSVFAPSPFGYNPPHCNEPYIASGGTSYALRIFGWLGTVFACLALFPQFIYNDSYMKSTAGLSFLSIGITMVSNLAFIFATTLPQHNDWFSNIYASGSSSSTTHSSGTFFRDQVVLPFVIAFGFTFLQMWVLIVQRAKYASRK